jgi:GNAT superfamily N-acetyltransferase
MHKLTFEVRPVEVGDGEALRSLFVGSTAEACAALAADAAGAVVAVDADAVVGVARWHELGTGEAEVAVYVAEAWRGNGLGRRLAAAAERSAESSGLRVSTSTMLGDAA